MKQMLRCLTALLLAMLLMLSLVGCNAAREVRASPRADKAVIKADNIKVTYDELYYLANTRAAELKKENPSISRDELRASLESFVAENLLNRTHALLSVAREYGIRPDRGDIARNVQAQMESVIENAFAGDRDAYIDSLNEAFLTDTYVRTFVAVENYIATEIVLEMLEKGKLDDSDEAALRAIHSKDFIRTVQVFISNTNGYTDEENRAHAREIADKLAAIADPDERYLAMRKAIGGAYNNDYSDTVGNGYYFARGEMDAAYEEAAFALKNVYDASDVIETDEGYYVIMLMEKEDAYISSNLETLKTKTYFIQLNAEVDKRYAELCESAETTSFYKSLDLTDLPVIYADGGEGAFLVTLAFCIVLGVGAAIAGVTLLLRRRKKA